MRPLHPLHLLPVLIVGLALMSASWAQQPVEGKEYKLIIPTQTPESTTKVEVIEFFSYACPHCAEFEPGLEAWVKSRSDSKSKSKGKSRSNSKSKSADIEYRVVPMVFRETWKAPAKLYFTLEAMGLVDKYHIKVYDAIHKEKKELFTDEAVKEWAKSVGIDSAKFNEVYDSFGIETKVQRAVTMGKEYGAQFTPALAVNGKFLTGPSMVTNPQGGLDYPRFFSVLDQLVDMARGKPAKKTKT